MSIRADYSLLVRNKELDLLLEKNAFDFNSNPALISTITDFRKGLLEDA